MFAQFKELSRAELLRGGGQRVIVVGCERGHRSAGDHRPKQSQHVFILAEESRLCRRGPVWDGGFSTPSIDRIAAQWIAFWQAYANSAGAPPRAPR